MGVSVGTGFAALSSPTPMLALAVVLRNLVATVASSSSPFATVASFALTALEGLLLSPRGCLWRVERQQRPSVGNHDAVGKGNRLRKQRCAERVLIERLEPQLPQADESLARSNPVPSLRKLLLNRGWVEQPADGVLAQMRFEFPASLSDFATSGPQDPDDVHPTTLLVCSESIDADGFLDNFEIYVDLVGCDGANWMCAQHTVPGALHFSFDDSGLSELTDRIDEIEERAAHWSR